MGNGKCKEESTETVSEEQEAALQEEQIYSAFPEGEVEHG